MCVIVVKTKGTDFVPADAIKLCFEHNPHGFAFAWNENGELKTFRSMDMQKALSRYKELTNQLDPATTAFMVHARLRTHGDISEANCHCWVHGNIAFAHNGMLDIQSHDNMTDSEIFFQELFAPVMDSMGMDFALKMTRMFIGTTNNKIAIINNQGEVFMTSGAQSFIKESFPGLKGKVYFSNNRWKPTSQFSSCLGFDPYSDVRKTTTGTNGKKVSGAGVSAGPRKRPAPATPLVVFRPDATLQEKYERLPF